MNRKKLLALFFLISTSFFTTQVKAVEQSPVFKGVSFDNSTHKSYATGSDNWPTTWGVHNSRDVLFTSWGDGGGFGGTNSDGRVSLGYGRIEGNPPNITGKNMWGGKNAECSANPSGKSYGIVQINGVHYMWRSPGSNNTNYQKTQLYRSDDGCSWSAQNVTFTQDTKIILPSVLQFGKNYQEARDNYVYMYSARLKTGSSLTMQVPGQIDLFRVPKDQITKRSTYQFFQGLSSDTPQWTSDLNARKPVLEISSGVGWAPAVVSYHAPSGRYLLVVDHGTPDGRGVSGQGLGIYDSPEPWGPWTKVEVIDNWNHEPSFFYNFPTKWMGPNGQMLWMVFSGTESYDSYNQISLNLLYQNNQTPTLPPTGSQQEKDLDGDGDIDFVDFNLLLENFMVSYDLYDYNILIREY